MGGEYTWCFSRMWVCVLVLVVRCCAEPLDGSVVVRSAEEVSQDAVSVCDIKGCNCTTAQHERWIVVNCTFSNGQIVDLRPEFLPSNTMELSVIGGRELRFHTHLFAGMKNLWRLRIDGTRNITIKKHAFFNINVTNLLVQISQCDSLVFESSSFANEGPVIVEVSRCGYVSVQDTSFSFLQRGEFQDIPRMELGQGAFILKPRINGKHGPVTTIKFRNVMIPTLPKDCFKSTLAEVSLIDSEVFNVMSSAFSGNTISAITIRNSSIHNVYASAFSDRTQLDSLEISFCKLHVFYQGALLSATTNLTIQHSKITTIHTGALNATIARTIFTNNEVGTFHSKGFALHDWSQVNIEYNSFNHLHAEILDVPYKISTCQDPCEITFIGNELSTLESGALKFITLVPDTVTSHFESNNFKYNCHCDIDKWLEDILGAKCPKFTRNNYCVVGKLIAACYDVQEGPALMKNFSDVVCDNGKDVIDCKTYSIDANIINNELSIEENNSQLIFGLVLGLVLLIAVIGTLVILLIHGGLWLKRKGYCVRFHNFQQYRVEEESTEVEDIMVTQDKIPDNHLPEELSQELLQALREKLEDPSTYNEAREMIERLYDHFIIEDSYTNNNRQEEETHLYEELGNLSQPIGEQEKTPARPFSFLRLIEERFNLAPTEQQNNKSVLVGEYSEPTDAEVHLYSELPQNKEGKQNEINEGLTQLAEPGSSTQRSNGSGRMAYRPLPDKPRLGLDPGEGPSTKF